MNHLLQRSVIVVALTMAAVLGAAIPAHAAALRAPGLEAPAAGGGVERPPVLTWKRVRGAATYQVAVSADPSFASIVTSSPIRTQNTATTISSKFADGKYYWRVRGLTKTGKAGKWSKVRSFTKTWTQAPNLLEPGDAFSVSWPSSPLVLKWSPVPYATRYHVVVATDPSLANPVVGGTRSQVETHGTSFALPAGLPSGRYFWAITPVDANGYTGRQSRVGTFVFAWPSTTTLRWEDIDPSAASTDPMLRWDPVPGAASYQVEVNTTADFVPGSLVWRANVLSTTATPTSPLLNNIYYWRVRAIDSRGNAGEWNASVFEKSFLPTVGNVRVRTEVSTGSVDPSTATDVPVFAWDPVAGADAYVLQVAKYQPDTDSCAWNGAGAFTIQTHHTAWVPGSKTGPTTRPDLTWPTPTTTGNGLIDGWQYCMRVLAQEGRNQSAWTTRKAAFTYENRAADLSNESCTHPDVTAAAYRTPAPTSVSSRTPLFTWNAIPGADSYWVVIARNPQFTNVVDVGFTDIPAYIPKRTLTDETTSYYWAVMPSRSRQGCIDDTEPNEYAYRPFHKLSTPPSPFAPAAGADVSDPPTFRWAGAEGAATYRLQIDNTPTFSSPLEDVTTASTAYATNRSYPVDTQLYWRVRAQDVKGVALAWSRVSTFRRRLPVPTIPAGNPEGGETIPVLRWNSTPGAISYSMHVDQADGTSRDFTMSSTAFTPTQFYGTGIWRWKVRANFPTLGGNMPSGGYSEAQTFVRRINPPARPSMTRAPGRVVFRWQADQAATKYRLEVSSSDSFNQDLESVTTEQTAWAPPMNGAAFRNGGKLYWRLANVDSGGNVGAFALGTFALPKAMKITVRGSAAKGRRSRLVVTVKDFRGRVVRKALVRATGVGLRRISRRTSKRGSAVFSLKARKRGTLKFSVSRNGFQAGTASVKVR